MQKLPKKITKYFLIFFIATSCFKTAFADNLANNLCKTDRKVFLDRKDVKVWNTTLCPNEELSNHSHNNARIAIANEDGELEIVYSNGSKKIQKFKKGDPVYLSKEQGMSAHKNKNISEHPINIMVIEIKHG